MQQAWKDWIKVESVRRTVFIIFVFDTLRTLESGVTPLIKPSDVAGIPLPAPDTVWSASTAEEWNMATVSFHSSTLNSTLPLMFKDPSMPDDMFVDSENGTAGPTNPLQEDMTALNRSDFGAFARLVMIITLLRGILDIGMGKRSKGTWKDVTGLWVSEEAMSEVGKKSSGKELRLEGLVKLFGGALRKVCCCDISITYL